ncbi:MAG: gamma-glutamyl-gamma-aminobutyrate hydrolase family protein [Muribaculaceae bacterium]
MNKELKRLPIIGITASIDNDGHQSLKSEYVTAIINAGAIPVIIPCFEIIGDSLNEIINCVDGILLSGGYDISPTLFDEPISPYIGTVNIVRDNCEFEVIRISMALNIPIFGICRGLQCINVALGGSLYQDLETEIKQKILCHNQVEPTNIPTHIVNFVNNSRTASLMPSLELATNSHHHQAVKRLGHNLTVTGMTDDGIVEAIESTTHDIIAVQFHPERMPDTGITILRNWIRNHF